MPRVGTAKPTQPQQLQSKPKSKKLSTSVERIDKKSASPKRATPIAQSKSNNDSAEQKHLTCIIVIIKRSG